MTALDDRPNGHAVPTADIPSHPIDTQTAEPDPAPDLRDRLQRRTAERELAHQFTSVDDDPVFETVRSPDEQTADRTVAKKIRKMGRKETLRAGKAEVRDARCTRVQQQWQSRAERARERVTNPDRALATDHRRWLYSSIALFALLAGGVLFMSDTVKLGLFGAAGSWIGYIVEPLASVLLVVSVLAQLTARQRDIPIPRGAVVFDLGLAIASLALNTVPWGLRFGFDPATTLVHILVPLLVIAAVVAWHLASRIYGDAIAASRQQGGQQADRLALLREAVRVGELPTDVSPNQVIKYLRSNLPTGIGHDAARRIARSFLGH